MTDFKLEGHKPRSVGEKWAARINDHRNFHKTVERPAWRKLINFYRGHFHKPGRSDNDPLAGQSIRTSINMTYAVLDSAVTGLLPPNIETAGTPAAVDVSQGQVDTASALVNHSFKVSRVRGVGKRAIIDCLLTGRAIFHVVYDADADAGVVTNADVTTTFFDLSANNTRQIRYWIQMRLFEPDEVLERVRNGTWPKEAAAQLSVGAYPDFADRTGVGRKNAEAFGEWAVTWLCYDMQERRVYTMPDKGEKVLQVEDMEDYDPFVLLTFSENAEDCRGMSELNLIAANQEDLNAALSQILHTVLGSSPTMLYDKGILSSEEAAKIQNAVPGAYVGVDLQSTAIAGRGLPEAFHQKPAPATHPDAWSLINQLMSAVSVVSALAPTQRGQTNGGRTATEQAMLDANIRTRLGSRQTDMRDAWVQVAENLHVINRLHMSQPKVVKITKSGDLRVADPNTIRDTQVAYDLTVYTPVEDNPAVRAEAVQRAIPLLMQIPGINLKEIVRRLLEALRLPWDVDALIQDAGGAPPPGLPTGAGAPASSPSSVVAQASGGAGAPPPPPMPPVQQAISQEAVAGRTQVG